jgi:hypothetical protein
MQTDALWTIQAKLRRRPVDTFNRKAFSRRYIAAFFDDINTWLIILILPSLVEIPS